MSDIIRIPFRGTEVLTIDVDGRPHVVLKPALEGIGVDAWTQIQKLRSRSWAVTSQRPVTTSDGKTYDMLTCDVRTFLMLLGTIDERRVDETVRPALIAYQHEVADAIEAYWTRGYAVNPRLDYQGQAAVLNSLRGVVDGGYLDALGRRLAGRALGETPEYDPLTKPLTTSQYLEEQGLSRAECRRVGGNFGKAVKQKYIEMYGESPPQIEDVVNRRTVPVAQYQERHRPLFDAAWREFRGGDAS